MKSFINGLLGGSVLLLISCIPQKKIEYLHSETKGTNIYSIPVPAEIKIKPNDELLIDVSSFDDVSVNYFQSQNANARMQGTNELSLSAVSYSVDNKGMINFPILGSFEVGGLTLDEAGQKLKTSLESYFNQPNVDIKFAYKKVTILGEVLRPGNYTYSRRQINLLETIGMAGDISIHGNKKDIYIIRKDKDEIIKYHVDLTNDNIVFTDLYYLRPDDIIYVKPNRSVKWQTISTPISLIFSTVSTTLLVINFISN